MKINYNGTEIELKYTFRGFIIYENIMGDSFKASGMKEVIVLMYSMLVASYPDISDFEHFVDWLDQNPGTLKEFSDWVADCMNKNNDVKDTNIKPQKETKNTKKHKEDSKN